MKGVALLALGWGLFSMATADTPLPQQALTVVLEDHVAMEGSTLRKAAEIAKGILREAGVSTEWKTCHCTDSNGTSQCQCRSRCCWPCVLVGILPKPLRENRATDEAISMAVVGSPRALCTIAYVYCGRVLWFAKAAQCDAFQILGHAIAHEIGHLLGNEHSKSGIMRADWNKATLRNMSRGYVLFSRDEARTMRANLAERTMQLSVSR